MINACVMLCARCRMWTSYKSSKGGVKRIDTICRVCGSRLRHTYKNKPYTIFQGVKLRYAPIGKGGYQSWNSILDIIPVYAENPHELASLLNKKLQSRKAKMMGFDFEEWAYTGIREKSSFKTKKRRF